MKFRHKPTVVDAWRAQEEKTVDTIFGPVKVQPGEYVIRLPSHEVQVVKPGTFFECFEEVAGVRSLIAITWQDGPVKEKGRNGVQVEDVIEVLEERLAELNKPPYACRETAIAVTKLQEARLWLLERTRNRTGRAVEGTSNP